MKKCIREFVKHVETLENEKDPDSDGCGFHREYKDIHEVQAKNRKENIFKSDAGKLDTNLKKNRYKDILPYDDHRVMLSIVNDDPTSDYINASKLKGVKGTGGYIATQGPVAATVNDFWRMVWENDVEIIFMACRIVELGKIKCKQYWNDLNTSDEFGDIKVFTEVEEDVSSDFILRHFKVTCDEETRDIRQYHYLGWPDHGIPKDPAHIKDLIGLVRQSRVKDYAPLCVHCSAGCGRTGAIVAIDYVWTLLEEGKFDDEFSLYKLICDFREQRMSIVQTADQYALVNKVLKSLCEEWLTKMATHTYENVEVNGDDENVVKLDQAPGSKNEVLNLVTPQQPRNKASTLPGVSNPVYSSINKNRATSERVRLPSEPEYSLAKPLVEAPPSGDVYSTVNKTRKSATNDPGSKPSAVPEVRLNGADARAVPKDQIPDKPPGFDERLPKVHGPKPTPASWET